MDIPERMLWLVLIVKCDSTINALYADVIIDNNGTPQALTAKLDTIWSERLEPLLQKTQ